NLLLNSWLQPKHITVSCIFQLPSSPEIIFFSFQPQNRCDCLCCWDPLVALPMESKIPFAHPVVFSQSKDDK
ncbi:hypothetical protein TorRG33x02_212580, partial [Trema orientale]